MHGPVRQGLTFPVPMVSRLIDRVVSPLRDGLARGLMRAGVRPNYVTVVGMLCTVGVGVALAAGRDYWRTWGLGLMIGAGACDLLDGAIAKLGQLRTRFGAVLDSTCDRVGDAALYLGAAFYFMGRPDGVLSAGGGVGSISGGSTAGSVSAAGPNLTLVLLSLVGLVWAYLISYLRARAEAEGADGRGGFWQRPERVVTVLLGMAFHHLTTAVWILGTLPLATVAHRLWRVRRSLAPADRGGTPERIDGGPRGFWGLILWRWPRGTVAFDVMAGAVVVAVVAWGAPEADPVRDILARLVGA
jgi:CDP-diacylglycerol---glycerol-3-phosphate 3-phosphatidyltransferase